MDTSKVKKADEILLQEKERVLDSIAELIVNEFSANRKIMSATTEQRIRDVHRTCEIINELRLDFAEVLKVRPAKK